MRAAIACTLVFLLLLTACTAKEQSATNQTGGNSSTPDAGQATKPPAQERPLPELPGEAALDPCAVDASDYALFRERNGSSIGLQSVRIERVGAYYKVRDATIYAQPAAWYNNDVTVQFSQGGGLMDFNRRLVPLDPNTGDCFVGVIPLNLTLRDLSVDTVSITLGQGRDRNGRQLVTAEGKVGLQDMVITVPQ